jgi:flavorubredoxin
LKTSIRNPNPVEYPRELAPGIFWISRCRRQGVREKTMHGCSSVYFVAGTEHSAVFDTGFPGDYPVLAEQYKAFVSRCAPLKYLFLTHSEMAHAGNTGLFLEDFPGSIAVGDVTDMHLVFPEYADRFEFADPGARYDLGGTEIVVVEGVFRDMVSSRWFLDTGSKVLFTGDGYSFSHYHEDGACGHLAEEIEDFDIPPSLSRFSDAAFYWSNFVDIEPVIARMDEVVFGELGATLIAPSHGLPIGDPAITVPYIKEGLRINQSGGVVRTGAYSDPSFQSGR